MTESINYVKIRAGLTKGLVHVPHPEGKIKFSDEFMERLYEVEEDFRSKLLVPLNEKRGLYNWALMFVEHPTVEPTFFADIWVDNIEDYPVIAQTIQETIKDMKFTYYYKGNMAAYIDNP